MSFHFSLPRPRLHLPHRTRVVDESGLSVDQRFFRGLALAKQLPDQPASPATPTRLSPVEERRNAVTVHTARPIPTWEERFAVVWDGVGAQLDKLSKFVTDKSAFDNDVIYRWSDHLRAVRVDGDRIMDGILLESASTREMPNLRDQISARILADALAATP